MKHDDPTALGAGVRKGIGKENATTTSATALATPPTAALVGRDAAGEPLTLDISDSLESLRGESIVAETPHRNGRELVSGGIHDALSGEEAMEPTLDFWDVLIDHFGSEIRRISVVSYP